MPLQQFIQREKSAGIVLGISIVVAMLLANSPWSDEYFHLFEHKLGFFFDGEPYLYYSLHHWINDGLMSMFFFVVGLELKREFIGGELADPRNTILPIGAAVAGMLVPALIYTVFNAGTPSAGGWGIPMATDIAFSLAIIYALGDRVPLAAKVFLTTLAIVDDLGAVVVIALFYTSEISVVNIAVGVAFLLVMYIANRMGVKNVVFYGLLGIGGVWVAFLMSGIHATIAAVLAAFVIPADARLPEPLYLKRAANNLRRFAGIKPNNVFHQCRFGRSLGASARQTARYRALDLSSRAPRNSQKDRIADTPPRRWSWLPGLHRVHYVDVHINPCLHRRHHAAASQAGHLRRIDTRRRDRLPPVEMIKDKIRKPGHGLPDYCISPPST